MLYKVISNYAIIGANCIIKEYKANLTSMIRLGREKNDLVLLFIAYYLLGDYLFISGDWESAITYYHDALKIAIKENLEHENKIQLFYNLGYLYEKMEKDSKIKWLKKTFPDIYQEQINRLEKKYDIAYTLLQEKRLLNNSEFEMKRSLRLITYKVNHLKTQLKMLKKMQFFEVNFILGDAFVKDSIETDSCRYLLSWYKNKFTENVIYDNVYIKYDNYYWSAEDLYTREEYAPFLTDEEFEDYKDEE